MARELSGLYCLSLKPRMPMFQSLRATYLFRPFQLACLLAHISMECLISSLHMRFMSMYLSTAENFIKYEDVIKLKDFLILNLVG
jgi:hypothetical protein